MVLNEYRICMPLSVEEYRIGQSYMIARHSLEQTGSDKGVEIIDFHECEDPIRGKGHYTEKRIHLNDQLPYWMQAIMPKVFYVTEKAWNYYPYTITEYSCYFLPKFKIHITTVFEDNPGTTENALNISEDELCERKVDYIDIVYDEVSPKHYKEEEDLRFFQSKKTGRGPLAENWQSKEKPIMCSYKLVNTTVEIWGLQTRGEQMLQQAIREILLLGHRQAFAWIDEWHDMTLEEVKAYEAKMFSEINSKIKPTLAPTSNEKTSQPTTPSAEQTPSSWFWS